MRLSPEIYWKSFTAIFIMSLRGKCTVSESQYFFYYTFSSLFISLYFLHFFLTQVWLVCSALFSFSHQQYKHLWRKNLIFMTSEESFGLLCFFASLFFVLFHENHLQYYFLYVTMCWWCTEKKYIIYGWTRELKVMKALRKLLL